MLKLATLEDLDLVLTLSLEFVKSTEYKDSYDEEKIKNLIISFLTSSQTERIIILYEDKGFLAGAIVPFLFADKKIATEIAWWVTPEARGTTVAKELVTSFEYWATKVGANMLSLISLDDQVGKLYEKNGYRLFERTYIKELN